MRVGSNGLLRQETENGDGTRTFDWFSRYPISTYLVSIAAGVYDVVEQTYDRPDSLNMNPLSLPILHYAFRGSNMYEGTGFDDGWKRVIEILPVQEYWFGPYPFPEEKYGHAQFTFGGGMEHQTMSSMGNNGVGLIAHELAHQWFGDLITTETWPHLWLNEGFATYSELLTWKSREHLSPGTYDRVFDLYYGRGLLATGTLVVQDTSSVGNLFSGTRVYAKGGMILHMLRSITGDAAFRDILRSYTSDADVRYGTATTADFQRIAEAVSGLDLDTFFRQWITEGTGHPVYDVWWRDLGGDQGYDVEVTIEQTQVSPASNVDVFEMPLTIQIETREGLEEFVVTNDERRQVFVFHVNGFPEDVRFDPERQILGMSSVSVVGGAAEEHPEIVQSLDVYPNPVRSTFTVEVELSSPASVRLSLYDVTGRRVRELMNETSRSFSNSFSMSDLPAGTYFLHIDTPQGRAVRQIILLGGNDRSSK
jgi:aminopeptidase N